MCEARARKKVTPEQHARAVEQNMRIYARQKARGALAIIGLTGVILFAGYWSYGKMVLFPVALGVWLVSAAMVAHIVQWPDPFG